MAITAAERSREIESLIKALVCNRRVYISDAENPARVQREIERVQERIRRDTDYIRAQLERMRTWRDAVESIDARIAELRKEQALLVVDKRLEAMARAQVAIEALLGQGYTIEQLTELAGAAAAAPNEDAAAQLLKALIDGVAEPAVTATDGLTDDADEVLAEEPDVTAEEIDALAEVEPSDELDVQELEALWADDAAIRSDDLDDEEEDN